MPLPILIGVTGHRHYRKEDESILRASVREVLSSLQKRCPHTELMLLSGLAEGADTLCAEEALSLGIKLTVVLPAEEAEFLKDFDEEGRGKYHELARCADSILLAPDVEAPPTPVTRAHRFRQEGIYLVEHCHVLLALWDGKEPKPGGCGTAEVVDMLRRGNYVPRKGVPLRSLENEYLICIDTPRGETDAPAGKITCSGNASILDETEAFNARAVDSDRNGHPLYESAGKTEAALDRLYRQASGLSGENADLYRKILRYLAATSTVIAVAFLLYDEVYLSGTLLFCGAGVLAAALFRRWAGRSDCHRRYIRYRELAESIRVQAYLRRAGSTLDVKNVFPVSLQQETPWIFAAMCALAVLPPDGKSDAVWQEWIQGQQKYHGKAKTKTYAARRNNDRWLNAATAASIALYFVALFFEFGVLKASFLTVTPVATATVRVCLKVFLGSVSAGTMFLSHYYGKLSLSRKFSDHQRMEKFYERMDDQRSMTGETEEWLEMLAREELIENSNWCAYQSDNALTMDV